MTEAEWLSRDNPKQLIKLMADRRAGRRKFYLFAAACCRRIWCHLDADRSQRAVEVLERYADGDETDLASARKLTTEALGSAGYGAFAPWEALRKGQEHVRAQEASVWAARVPAILVSATGVNGDQKTFGAERRAQCHLFRDIFGNPFRPVSLDAAWRTGTAVALASQVYESRDFGAMPILADALQDAGCDSDDILDHCRDPHATHVRGCWVVDLVLGKA